jgi:hypothetical protein
MSSKQDKLTKLSKKADKCKEIKNEVKKLVSEIKEDNKKKQIKGIKSLLSEMKSKPIPKADVDTSQVVKLIEKADSLMHQKMASNKHKMYAETLKGRKKADDERQAQNKKMRDLSTAKWVEEQKMKKEKILAKEKRIKTAVINKAAKVAKKKALIEHQKSKDVYSNMPGLRTMKGEKIKMPGLVEILPKMERVDNRPIEHKYNPLIISPGHITNSRNYKTTSHNIVYDMNPIDFSEMHAYHSINKY